MLIVAYRLCGIWLHVLCFSCPLSSGLSVLLELDSLAHIGFLYLHLLFLDLGKPRLNPDPNMHQTQQFP